VISVPEGKVSVENMGIGKKRKLRRLQAINDIGDTPPTVRDEWLTKWLYNSLFHEYILGGHRIHLVARTNSTSFRDTLG
jgi:RAB protein geranylgeranyltransferase component A